MSRRDENLDIDALLRVDVASELDRIARAQLEGSWQLPAELVRRAIARGSNELVDVRVRKGQFEVDDRGAAIEPELLRHLASLLDEDARSQTRHTALTLLEAAGATALIALAGLKPRRLSVDSGAWSLTYAHGEARPRLVQHDPPIGTNRFHVEDPTIDTQRALDWLKSACRFTPVPVLLNGAPLSVGFRDAIAVRPVSRPLPGHLAIPREGEAATVWLLDSGVITGHLTLPDTIGFEAAVELGGGRPQSAAELREIVKPHLAGLKATATNLLASTASKVTSLTDSDVRRLRRVVLGAVSRDRGETTLRAAPIFLAYTERGRSQVWLSLNGIASAAKSQGGNLAALYPGQSPSKYALGEGPALILDPTDRSVLADVTGIQLMAPQTKDAQRPFMAKLRLARRRTVDALRRIVLRLLPAGSRPLADSELLDPERAFLNSVAGHMRPMELLLCGGSGRIRRTGNTILLPRENHVVVASIRAVKQNPKYIYPVCLALLDGRAFPSEQTRQGWLV